MRCSKLETVIYALEPSYRRFFRANLRPSVGLLKRVFVIPLACLIASVVVGQGLTSREANRADPSLTLLTEAALIDSVSGHQSARISEQVRIVALFDPGRSADEHVDDYTFRQAQLMHWEKLLRTYNIASDRVGSRQLLSGLPGYNLLILPHLRAFTQDEREVILEFIERGNGIILVGETGRFAYGSDPTTLSSELGIEFRASSLAPKPAWLTVLDGPSYLAAGLPRMQNMSIAVRQPIALTHAPEAIAFWLDQSISNPNFDDAAKDIAIASGQFGRGRFVWIGFPINSVGGDLNSSEAFHQLFNNIYDYFTVRPRVSIAPWPYPYSSTIILSMDVEQQFGNIRSINNIENLPPFTYFALTHQAELYADFLYSMIQAPDGTAELSLHGDNHDVFRGQPPAKQLQRMLNARATIERITGKPPPGFRPPEEAYDFYTIQAMVDAGYTYLLADSSPDRAEPRIVSDRAEPLLVETDHGRLVQFTMFNKDDVKMVVSTNWPDPEDVYEEYIKDVKNVLSRESLHIVSIHSHILATPEYISVFVRFIDHVRDNYDVWMANCGMVADWWRRKSDVELIVSSRSHNSIVFRLENQSAASLERLAVELWLPEATQGLEITSSPSGLPTTEYTIEGKRMRMHVASLKPDELREYEITWAVSE